MDIRFNFSAKVMTTAQANAWRSFETLVANLAGLSQDERNEISIVCGRRSKGVTLELEPLDSDPDIEPGGYLTLQRQDGRSLWQQRFVVVSKEGAHYVLKPVGVFHGFVPGYD